MNTPHNASAIYRRTLATAIVTTIVTLAVTGLFTNLLTPDFNASFVRMLTVTGCSCIVFSLVLFAYVETLARNATSCEMHEMDALTPVEDFIPDWMGAYVSK